MFTLTKNKRCDWKDYLKISEVSKIQHETSHKSEGID